MTDTTTQEQAPADTNAVSGTAERFTKKPITITASQWFKNGDHPGDHAPFVGSTEQDRQRYDDYLQHEGKVVRYYRRPDVSGESLCEQCGKPHHIHGWIDTLEQGHRVCPGDWIITGVAGEMYPCKPDIFEATYSRAALAAPAQQPWQYTPPAQERIDALELEVRQLTEQIAGLRHAPTPQADSQPAPANTRQIAECYGDCPEDPKTCANPCKFEGRAARAPADSVLEDAARYRWIRGPVEESTRYSRWRIEYWDGPNGWQPMQRERMDSAIDAARKQGANHD